MSLTIDFSSLASFSSSVSIDGFIVLYKRGGDTCVLENALDNDTWDKVGDVGRDEVFNPIPVSDLVDAFCLRLGYLDGSFRGLLSVSRRFQ
jgi:hypothetical protein